MMAKMTTTTHKKKTMMPGIASPATVLELAMAGSYPTRPDLFTGTRTSCVPGLAGEPSDWRYMWRSSN
jgi:hypothetical protein